MVRNWRAWVLLLLLVGPILAYILFGFFWLAQRGWVLYASAIWMASGVVLYILGERWTKDQNQLMPPIDWDAPQTFSPFDHQAWKLVQEEADGGDKVALEDLSRFDIYIETGRRLAQRLAAHYHPLSNDPVENVPVVDLLTALELAAEDLTHLCREVPGGDMITPAHWKRTVQAAGYIQKANDIYTYLMPIFQPLTGLARLGAQKLMVQPAWKNMQQNLMRWFYRAFVNRLGTHLIELYSGRLAIGADRYRKLTRKSSKVVQAVEEELSALTIAVAGARGAGKTRLIEALDRARSGDLGAIGARLAASGLDETLADRLKSLQWVEVPGYIERPGEETARERLTRREAVEAAVEADFLLLVVAGASGDVSADVEFVRAWERWYAEHLGHEVPPALAVVTGVDRPGFGDDWKPPYNWSQGRGPREAAVRAKLDTLRAALPPAVTEVVAVGLGPDSPFGVTELVLPAIAALLPRAERAGLIRHLKRVAGRPKIRRLLSQVGQQGRRLWQGVKSSREVHADGKRG